MVLPGKGQEKERELRWGDGAQRQPVTLRRRRPWTCLVPSRAACKSACGAADHGADSDLSRRSPTPLQPPNQQEEASSSARPDATHRRPVFTRPGPRVVFQCQVVAGYVWMEDEWGLGGCPRRRCFARQPRPAASVLLAPNHCRLASSEYAASPCGFTVFVSFGHRKYALLPPSVPQPSSPANPHAQSLFTLFFDPPAPLPPNSLRPSLSHRASSLPPTPFPHPVPFLKFSSFSTPPATALPFKCFGA